MYNLSILRSDASKRRATTRRVLHGYADADVVEVRSFSGKSFLYGASVAALVLTLPCLPAAAQEARAGGAVNADSTIEDIVVTAQRREEKLSNVPVSVVAYGAEQLQARNINSEQDIGMLVPGLQVKNGQNSNQLSYSMRGQSLDPFSGTSPAVLPYLNEAPYNPGNTATAFFDLASIQVLKGPQGTLFGRNATGGAVLYTTPMPGDKFSGFLITRGASRDYVQVQGAADLPLVANKLATRLAFDVTRGNGYITNVHTGNTLGDKNSRSGRGTVLFTPTETVKNVTIFQYDRVRGSEGAGGIYNYYSATNPQFISDGTNHIPAAGLSNTLAALYGNNNGPAAPGFFPGAVEGYTAFTRANPYKVWLEYDLPHKARNVFASNTTEIQISDTAQIKNIFSYMNGRANTPGNLAGGPFGSLWLFKLAGINATGAPGGQTFRSKTYSDEVQVQGTAMDERLKYTAGAFYSDQKRFEIIPINIGHDLPSGSIADISYAYRNGESSKAVYAQASYDIIDRLTLTLGGRYTWEDVNIRQAAGNVFGVDPTSAAAYQSKKLSAPAWTASLQYRIDDSNMVYFNQRGSFRAGNLNGTVAPFIDPLTGNPANQFKNEKVRDFELGYKFNGSVSGVPVQFNVAAYQVNVTDAQRALYAIVGGAPAGFTVNVPKARTRGAEIDGVFDLTSWLDLGFNVAYTNAKYTNSIVPIPFVGTLSVDSYPDTPKWAGSINAEIKFPVPENVGKVSLRGEYYGQTSFYFSNTNGTSTPGTQLSGYHSIGMHLNWKEIMETQVSAAFFVRNLTNNTYYISGYALGSSNGVNTAYPGEPRTFGAEISYKF